MRILHTPSVYNHLAIILMAIKVRPMLGLVVLANELVKPSKHFIVPLQASTGAGRMRTSQCTTKRESAPVAGFTNPVVLIREDDKPTRNIKSRTNRQFYRVAKE